MVIQLFLMVFQLVSSDFSIIFIKKLTLNYKNQFSLLKNTIFCTYLAIDRIFCIHDKKSAM